jgi:hypothetical protein
MFKVTEFGENEQFVFADFSVEESFDFAPWFVSSQSTGKNNCGALD